MAALLGVRRVEEHGALLRRNLKGARGIEHVGGATYAQAAAELNDAARGRLTGDVGVLEPGELAALEDEPALAPGADMLPLLPEPAGVFRGVPKNNISRVSRCARS